MSTGQKLERAELPQKNKQEKQEAIERFDRAI